MEDLDVSRERAFIAANFVHHVFLWSQMSISDFDPCLFRFIWTLQRRSAAHPSVTFRALYYLQNLKHYNPTMVVTSGESLFLCALGLAGKSSRDHTLIKLGELQAVAFAMSLDEVIDIMEYDVFNALECGLDVDAGALADFEARVRRDFSSANGLTCFDAPNHAIPVRHRTEICRSEISTVPFPSLAMEQKINRASASTTQRCLCEYCRTPAVTSNQ
ncbi:uncharacterized protein LAESUDRAFT_36928 [Laetiporus sulphureus 93-53]|uniref:Cyclin N-terminal domain-containing protein n=1 Tax=Laetiporus sulphureus 93-53 TaxID=1314785 RepID=A0A165ILS3_9APHY|nr:uncharacterized protein LAESUDRAFT_36928 [Laetiporus sulphureus 93-53]KZT13257.1 hypothetical protein LAESUDRAFT_36928 [Laetiporus sulphureus 93-53]